MLSNGWLCVPMELTLFREQQSASFLWVIPFHYEASNFKIWNSYPVLLALQNSINNSLNDY